jgi:hypothetical protein
MAAEYVNTKKFENDVKTVMEVKYVSIINNARIV